MKNACEDLVQVEMDACSKRLKQETYNFVSNYANFTLDGLMHEFQRLCAERCNNEFPDISIDNPFQVMLPRLFRYDVKEYLKDLLEASGSKINQRGDAAEELVFSLIKQILDEDPSKSALVIHDMKPHSPLWISLTLLSPIDSSQFPDFIVIHEDIGAVIVEVKKIKRGRAKGMEEAQAQLKNGFSVVKNLRNTIPGSTDDLFKVWQLTCSLQGNVQMILFDENEDKEEFRRDEYKEFSVAFKKCWEKLKSKQDSIKQGSKVKLSQQPAFVDLCKKLVGLYFCRPHQDEYIENRNEELQLESNRLRLEKFTSQNKEPEDQELTSYKDVIGFPSHEKLGENKIYFLTKPQKELFEWPYQKAVVLGCAGTGKTVMIIAKAMQKALDGDGIIIFAPRAVYYKYREAFPTKDFKNVSIIDINGNAFDNMVFEKTKEIYTSLAKATKSYFKGTKPQTDTDKNDMETSLSIFSNVLRCLLENACYGKKYIPVASTDEGDFIERWIGIVLPDKLQALKITETWIEVKKKLRDIYNGNHIFIDDAFSEFVRQIVYGRYITHITEDGKVVTNNVVLHTVVVILWLIEECQKDEWKTCFWIANDNFQFNNGYSRFFENVFWPQNKRWSDMKLDIQKKFRNRKMYFAYFRFFKKNDTQHDPNYGHFEEIADKLSDFIFNVSPSRDQTQFKTFVLDDILRSGRHVTNAYQSDFDMAKEYYGIKLRKQPLEPRHKIPGERIIKNFVAPDSWYCNLTSAFVSSKQYVPPDLINYIKKEIKGLLFGCCVNLSDIAILTPNMDETQEYLLQHYLRFALEESGIKTCTANLYREDMNSVIVDFGFNALSLEKLVIFSIGYRITKSKSSTATENTWQEVRDPGLYISKSRCRVSLYELLLAVPEKTTSDSSYSSSEESEMREISSLPRDGTQQMDVNAETSVTSNTLMPTAKVLPVIEEENSDNNASNSERQQTCFKRKPKPQEGLAKHRKVDESILLPVPTTTMPNDLQSRTGLTPDVDQMHLDHGSPQEDMDIFTSGIASSTNGFFEYDFALVSRVAHTFYDTMSSYDLLQGDACIELARREHAELVDALRRIKVDAIEPHLLGEEVPPDGLFIGDIAVVIKDTALMCRPFTRNVLRDNELKYVRKELEKKCYGLKVISIKAAVDGEETRLDGSDILWTGREIFVGWSNRLNRTNKAGAREVQRVFGDKGLITTLIEVHAPIIHLRDYMSMVRPDVIAVGGSEGKQLFKTIEEMYTAVGRDCPYRCVEVVEAQAANVIYANSVILQLDYEQIPEGSKMYNHDENTKDCPRIGVRLTEILKRKGGRLSKCVLLINRL